MACDQKFTKSSLDALLASFEETWRSGATPKLRDWLPPPETVMADGLDARTVLVELVHLDLEHRWRRHHAAGSQAEASDAETAPAGAAADWPELSGPPKLEDYVARFPELGPADRLPIELIVSEYLARHCWGDRPPLGQYLWRFPALPAGPLKEALRRTDEQLALCAAPVLLAVRCPHCGERVVPKWGESASSCPQCGGEMDPAVGAGGVTAVSGAEPRYQRIHELGRGTFGSVWKAYDRKLKRYVALKSTYVRPNDPADAEMLLREARVLARLHHPHVVAVHDAGRDEDHVYISTDLVDGVRLDQWLESHPFSPCDVVRICRKLAEALHYCHGRGVIHRDLKPGNILIDDNGNPHVTDFGLARRTAGDPSVSIAGDVLGTPAYMAPEQASGQAQQADPRSDVYSLGVLLFQMLTGERPFRGNLAHLLYQVVHTEAPDSRTINNSIDPELAAICAKCLRKDPADRYQTAEELADDLNRYGEGRPVAARRGRFAGMLKRSFGRPVRQRPWMLLLLTALVAAGGLWWVRTPSKATQGLTSRAQYNINLLLARDRIAQHPREALSLLESPVHFPRELREFTWNWLCSTARAKIEPPKDGDKKNDVLTSHEGHITSVDLSPDGTLLASGDVVGTVRLVDRPTGRQFDLISTEDSSAGAVARVRFTPDGKRLAVAGTDGRLESWDVASQVRQPLSPQLDADVRRMVFSPDGRFLACVVGDAAKIQILDGGTFQRAASPFEHAEGVVDLAYAEDGEKLATAHQDGTISIWNTETLERVGAPLAGHVGCVCSIWFPGGANELVSVGSDGRVFIWDLATRQPPVLLDRTVDPEIGGALALDPGGRILAVADGKDCIGLWDFPSRRSIGRHRNITFLPAPGQTRCVTLNMSPDGRQVVAGIDRFVVGFGVEHKPKSLAMRGQGEVLCCGFSSDGRTLAVGGEEGVVKLWEWRRACPLRTIETGGAWCRTLAFARDNSVLVTGSTEGQLHIWEPETGRLLRTLGEHHGAVHSMSFSAGGLLASGGEDAVVRVWKGDTWDLSATLPQREGQVRAVTFSRDGSMLASAGDDGRIELSVTSDWCSPRRLAEHDAPVMCLDFSPDGRLLASGDRKGVVIVWQAATGRVKAMLRGAEGTVDAVAFAPDGQTLLAGGSDGRILVWDVVTGGLRLTIEPNDEAITDIEFAPSKDGFVYLTRRGDIDFLPASAP